MTNFQKEAIFSKSQGTYQIREIFATVWLHELQRKKMLMRTNTASFNTSECCDAMAFVRTSERKRET